MNAHHKKRRKSEPLVRKHLQYLSTGVVPGSSLNENDVLEKVIGRVPFGWQLDIIIPFVSSSTSLGPTLPIELLQLFHDQSLGTFYYSKSVNLSDLLTPTFLNTYIRNAPLGMNGKSGSLMCLSVSTSEQDDSKVCIDSRGRLVLIVSKLTYEILGLQGRPSMYNRGSDRECFVIEIDLKDESFTSGKKGFERVKERLRSWPTDNSLFNGHLDLKCDHNQSHAGGETSTRNGRKSGRTFEMMFQFTDSEGKTQPIIFPQSIKAFKREAAHTHHTLQSLRIPRIESYLGLRPVPSSIDAKNECGQTHSKRRKLEGKKIVNAGQSHLLENSESARMSISERLTRIEEFEEWRGLVSNSSGQRFDAGNDNLSSSSFLSFKRVQDEDEEEYGIPLNSCQEGRVWVGHWTGFFNPQTVSCLNSYLRQRLTSLPSNDSEFCLPFISTTLTPHFSSPISHLSSQYPQITATRKKPNGKRIKRGKGQGEEEEADPNKGAEYGYSITLWQQSVDDDTPSSSDCKLLFLLKEGQ